MKRFTLNCYWKKLVDGNVDPEEKLEEGDVQEIEAEDYESMKIQFLSHTFSMAQFVIVCDEDGKEYPEITRKMWLKHHGIKETFTTGLQKYEWSDGNEFEIQFEEWEESGVKVPEKLAPGDPIFGEDDAREHQDVTRNFEDWNEMQDYMKKKGAIMKVSTHAMKYARRFFRMFIDDKESVIGKQKDGVKTVTFFISPMQTIIAVRHIDKLIFDAFSAGPVDDYVKKQKTSGEKSITITFDDECPLPMCADMS